MRYLGLFDARPETLPERYALLGARLAFLPGERDLFARESRLPVGVFLATGVALMSLALSVH